MPGLTSGLNIGLTGLQAAQSALNVVGHNITNVNTPGYSRQKALLSTNTSQPFGSLQFGMGVTLSNILGVRDRFAELQITQTTSRKTGADVRYAGMTAISTACADTGDASLSSVVQSFFQGFQDLAARPENDAVRTSVVGRAQTLVNGLKSRYQFLTEQRQQADRSVQSLVEEVNTITSEIAKLNERIAQETSPGANNDARDQRQALANDLAELVGIHVFENDQGSLEISLDSGEAVLVNGTHAFEITTTPDPALGGMARLESHMAGSLIDITRGIKDGKLGAFLDLRDNLITGHQRELDQLAAGIASQVNLLHRTGYALDGVTRNLDLFQGSVPNGANGLPPSISSATFYQGMVLTLGVNTAIAGDPSLLGTASLPNAPGNNVVAAAIANLQNTTATVDTNGDGAGDTGPYSSVIGSLVNTIGTQAHTYQIQSTSEEHLLTGLQNQRDSVSGVDLDEEAANLMTFQRGYQASARFINVIDQLTDQLVNQFGR